AVRDATDQLAAYGPELLTNGSETYSPLLSFWAGLVNGFPTRIGSFTDRLSERLVANTVQFGPEEGLIRHIDGTSTLYSAVLSLSEWGEESSGAIIRDLLRLEGRLTILQTIQGLDKAQAVFDLAKNARQALLGFKNPFASGDFEEAEANIRGDRASYLRHQLSIFLTGETKEELDRLVSQARRVFLAYGLKPAIEGAAAEWLWRCRLPGFDTFVRPTNLLSHNLAHLCTFQREPVGAERCDWGEGPLRLFKTASGSAYAFQLHASEEKEALANAAVIAPAGSGKTTFFEHVIGGALRHDRLRAYVFDRFNGTRIFTQATGGTYIDLADAKTTQLNPLQVDD